MLNMDKYKDEIMECSNGVGLSSACAVRQVRDKGPCTKKCNICMMKSMNWMFEEYAILDEVERKYLSSVIGPFRDKVLYIQKASIGTDNIRIGIKNDNTINLPCFKKDTMYKNMKAWEKYTLEELGI